MEDEFHFFKLYQLVVFVILIVFIAFVVFLFVFFHSSRHLLIKTIINISQKRKNIRFGVTNLKFCDII